jgi:hypothetical protein
MEKRVVHLDEQGCDDFQELLDETIETHADNGWKLIDTELDTYYDAQATIGYANVILTFSD